MQQKVRAYYSLTKPGIVYSNTLAAAAGFFLASKLQIDVSKLIGIVFGVAFIIAASCVLNNILDRGIDQKMARTSKRALVQKTINAHHALAYGIILGLIGFGILWTLTNPLTVLLGAIAMAIYVFIYAAAKRGTVHGTLIGSIPGALPAVAGYTAVTGRLDMAAVWLFFLFVFWQMPHFYAIAIYRRKDYAAAGIPVLPVKKGIEAAKREIVLYVIGFLVVSAGLTTYGYTGITYLIVMLTVVLGWIILGVKGYKKKDNELWARGMFFYSLVVMLVMCFMVSIGGDLA